MRPFVWVIQLGLETVGQLVIGHVAEHLFLVPDTSRVAVVQPVLIPLRVLPHFAVSRDRIDAPMNEDAELGILEPLRHRPLVQRFPRGLIFLRMRSRQRGQGEHQQQNLSHSVLFAEDKSSFLVFGKVFPAKILPSPEDTLRRALRSRAGAGSSPGAPGSSNRGHRD